MSTIIETELQLYDISQAQIMRRDYVCSRCWGHLEYYAVKSRHVVQVACPHCGVGYGFVTRRYSERRQSESIGELREARHNLAGLIPDHHHPKSEAETIRELVGGAS